MTPYPPPQPRMTPGRWIWLSWCGIWTIIWALAGFFSFGLAWFLIISSLLAMLLVLIPPRQRQLPGQPPFRVLPLPPPPPQQHRQHYALGRCWCGRDHWQERPSRWSW